MPASVPSFRDPRAVAGFVRELRALTPPPRAITCMHVCGTHESAVARFGLRGLLPEWLRLIAGPGCPVCVCPAEEIARAARLALEPGVVLASFGDMVRVPGHPSLEEARGRGGDVRVVLGVDDAVELARAEPDREVVFFAVGFETTACTTAAALLCEPPANFSVLCAHRRIPPALEALLALEDVAVDAFLLPGHVIAVAGLGEYERAVREGGRPAAVAGFEPLDVLLGLRELVRMSRDGSAELVNVYRRAVRPEGNPRAREAMDRAFRVIDAAWRGLGVIPGSGYDLREEFATHDARRRFAPLLARTAAGLASHAPDLHGCRCGDVMVGRIDPSDCRLFAAACTPESPQGACMVSAEGTCRTRYLFREVR